MPTEFIGIDFGAKRAGTTAICFLQSNKLVVRQVEVKRDADQWLEHQFEEIKPTVVYVDAPLSLPGVYQGKNGDDYFYRKCDRDAGAMSPMFIGGLTARAMQMMNSHSDIRFVETYPKLLAREWNLDQKGYKKTLKSLEACIDLLDVPSEVIQPVIQNWHQFDAVLCWLSGLRVNCGEASQLGDPKEGLIWF